MNLLRTIPPYLVSSAVMAVLLYNAPPGERIPSGMPVAAGILGALISIQYWVLYVLSDIFRLWRRWPAWTLCPIGAGFCAVLTLGLWLCLPVSASGLRSLRDVFYCWGEVLVMPSLIFGAVYTMS